MKKRWGRYTVEEKVSIGECERKDSVVTEGNMGIGGWATRWTTRDGQANEHKRKEDEGMCG